MVQSIIVLLILIKYGFSLINIIDWLFYDVCLLPYVTHRWIVDLFRKGAKTDLEESDIYRPLKADNSELVTDHLEK
jgi:hypothetical protein